MASRKSSYIAKGEKYMDDACDSVFLNLHKAAKRKSDYVWSTTKFDSLTSIWGDDLETKPNNIRCDDSVPKTNKMNDRINSAEKDSKIKWTSVIKHNGDTLNAKNIEIRVNDYKEETEENVSKMEWTVCNGDSENELNKYHTTQNALPDNSVKFNHQSLGGLTLPSGFASNQTSSENNPESVTKINKSNLNGKVARSSSEEFITNVGKEESAGITKVKDTPEITTKYFNKNSQRKYSERQQDDTKRDIFRNVPTEENRLNLSKENVNPGIVNDEVAVKKSVSKVRYQHPTSKSQQNINFKQNEQMILRPKRTRHDSESSTNSNVPLQKKLLGGTEYEKERSFDTGKGFLDTMLSVKIIKDDQHEIIVSLSDFERIKKKFPKLLEVFPTIDTGEKEIHYCADAVKAIFGFLFNSSYNFNMIPEGRAAVEILAATKSWNMLHFHNNFQSHLLKKITKTNFKLIHLFASHFGLHEICDACKNFISPGESLKNDKDVRPRKCSIAVSQYIEPVECNIPLETVDAFLRELNDDFDKDIRNTVIFEAISSDFNIKGFRILLDTDGGNKNLNSTMIDIFYSVKIVSDCKIETAKLSKPVRPNIVIYFKKKITVKRHQSMQLSVETTIKPQLCFTTEENFIREKSGETEFSLTLESTYRVKKSGKRFIVGKLLYNSKDPSD